MRKVFLAFVLLSTQFLQATAGTPEDSLQIMMKEQMRVMDSIESSLHYKTGKIDLGGGIATINVPAGFKFLDAAEAKYVIEDLWGNPKGNAPLGALFPASSGATDAGSYAFIIQYEDMGYVKDSDAYKINYD